MPQPKAKKGLHIPANERREKVEQIAKEAKQPKQKPKAITLDMVYEQQQKLVEQNAYIIELLRK